MFYINWVYIAIVLPAMIFAMIASSRVNSTFNRFSNEASSKGLTGAECARMVLDQKGLYDVKINKIRGKLTDNYNPRTNTVNLSSAVYDSTSIAAIGVALHEVGHALQYAEGYFFIKVRNLIIPLTNIASRLSTPLIIIGILLSYLGEAYSIIAYIGVGLFMVAILFQLITLPVEYNASNRAIINLDEVVALDGYEIDGARKVLKAAALTYVAALAVSLSQLIYLLRILNRNTNRR